MCPCANYAEERRREFIQLSTFVSYGETILFPDAIKERHDAVVEDIQKSPKRRVFMAAAFYDEFRIMMRKNTEWSGKAHESDRHFRRFLRFFRVPLRDFINLGRRKRECLAGAKTNGLAFDVA